MLQRLSRLPHPHRRLVVYSHFIPAPAARQEFASRQSRPQWTHPAPACGSHPTRAGSTPLPSAAGQPKTEIFYLFYLFFYFFPGAARLCVLEHRCLAMSLSNAAASAQSPPCGGCWGGTDVTAGTRSHPHPSSPRGVPSAAASPHAALSVPRMPRDAFPSPETLPWCWL